MDYAIKGHKAHKTLIDTSMHTHTHTHALTHAHIDAQLHTHPTCTRGCTDTHAHKHTSPVTGGSRRTLGKEKSS